MIEDIIARIKKGGNGSLMGEPASYNQIVNEMVILEMSGFPLIPDDYINFLTDTANGFCWNGHTFYGTDPLEDELGLHVIDDLFSATQYWDSYDEFHNKLVLGGCDDDLYVFNDETQEYEIVDRCGKDALETFPSFEALFADLFLTKGSTANNLSVNHPKNDVSWQPRWEIPDHEYHSQIVSIINKINDLELFDLDSTSVKITAVPFYHDYKFMVVTGFSSIPPLTMHFFINDLDIIKLNGDGESFDEVNSKAKKIFTTSTIRDYLRLCMRNVQADEGNFRIVENIEEVEFSADPTAEQYEALKKVIAPMEVTDEDEGFLINAIMTHGSEVFKVKILIDKEGALEVLEDDLLLEDMPVRPIMLK